MPVSPALAAQHAPDVPGASPRPHRLVRHPRGAGPLLPGLGLAALATAAAMLLHLLVPTVSPLLIAILLGAVLANAVRLGDRVQPGLGFAAKQLLRLGIVLLGLQIVVPEVLALGAGMLAVVVAVVAAGFAAVLATGRLLRVPYQQSVLIGSGFSICGAAAVAGAEGVVDDAEEEEVVTAIALVVVFGTLMIPVVPFLAALLGMPELSAGLWAGASIHEVAQVVAAGGALGDEALAAAVIVKLSRVLMLAPVMLLVGLAQRRRRAAGTVRASATGAVTRPALVPGFVLGFIAAMIVASLSVVPPPALSALSTAQTVVLTAAMFALGTGVTWSRLRTVGGRPVVLAVAGTLAVALTALLGVGLVQPW